MPDDPNQPAAVPAPSPNSEFAEKLLQLERARQDSEDKRRLDKEELLRAFDEKLGAMAKKLEPQKPDPQNPLGVLKDEDLQAVVAQGQDSENPQKWAIAQQELMRRRDQALLAEADRRQEARIQQQRQFESAIGQIKETYGDEIFKKGTELNSRAEMYMANLQREHGSDIRWNPEAQKQVAALAYNDHLKTELEKAKADRAELEAYKKKATLQRGNENISRPGEDTKALLKKGKVEDAIKSMNIHQRLFGGQE